MAIKFYDEALYNKLQNWLPAELSKSILKPDETSRMFKLRDDDKKDAEFTLPLIALSRDSNIELLDVSKGPLSFNGKRIGGDEDKSILLNAIPISIYYQIDIYTKYYDEADALVRELIFKFLNNPKIKVNFPYNGFNLEHNAYVRLSSTITDNSDIPERLAPGEFTRFTIQLEIKDAYFFSIPEKENYKIDLHGANTLNVSYVDKSECIDGCGIVGTYEVETPTEPVDEP